jgi:TonB family protein
MNHGVGRAAIVLSAAIGALAAFGGVGGAQQTTPRPTPTPAICARPNVAASIIKAVQPDIPAIGAQQGIYGTVQVVVSLNADSQVTGTRIQSSPSTVLNRAALAAARQTTFQTEIRDCRPIAADYIFSVAFRPQATFSTTSSGEWLVTVVGRGSVTRAPDSAVVQTRIITFDDVAAKASADNDALFDALKAKLAALGIGQRKIDVQSSLLPSGPGPTTPGLGYRAMRQIAVTVDTVANTGHAAAAIASSLSFAEGVTIRFALNDNASASRDALAIAVKDAEKAARDAVTSQRWRLGPHREIVVTPSDRTQVPSTTVRFSRFPIARGFTESDRVPDVEVRAEVIVTYSVKP